MHEGAENQIQESGHDSLTDELSARGQHWTDCDADLRAFIDRVVTSFRRVLDENLVGVYLHGSLAAGCFRRAKSDLDLLIVIRTHLNEVKYRELALMLVELSESRPTLGDLELSVIQGQHALNFIHPLPYELHFGGAETAEAIRRGELNYGQEKRDRDLAAHCTVTHARGICLWGAPVKDVFGPVPWEDFVDAVKYDFEWIVAGDNILESPFYSVLNSCRVIQLLREGKGTVASKEEGGRWGLAHLPDEHRSIIQQTLDCYCSARIVSAEERKTGGLAWDAEALRQFRDFAAIEVVRLTASL